MHVCARWRCTPDELLMRVSSKDQLEDMAEYAATYPEMALQFGILTAALHNAHFKGHKQPWDFYPCLRPRGRSQSGEGIDCNLDLWANVIEGVEPNGIPRRGPAAEGARRDHRAGQPAPQGTIRVGV